MLDRRREVLIGISLFAAALMVRLIFAARLVFPPLDDPAFYIQTARNLAAGRGLMIDVIWNYSVPFASVTHPSHEYWMPLATFLIAPFLRLWGNSLWAAQLPGLMCGALLVPITFGLARYLWPDVRDRRWAVLAALLLIAGALPVYQAASTDSAAPFALCVSLALIAGGLAIERRSVRWSLLAGVMSGLSYLARSDGLLVPALIVTMMIGSIALRQLSWINVVSLVGATAAIVGAWWLRNLNTFGVPQPASPWPMVALQNYGQLFNWQVPPTLSGLLAQGASIAVDLRWQALQHNVGVWLIMSFPYGIYGLPGLFSERRTVIRLGLIYALTLYFVTAIIFSVPTLMGLFYHSAGATLPWLAIGGALGIKRIWRRWRLLAVALCLVTIVLILMQTALAWPSVIADSRANQTKFAAVTEWLRPNVPLDQPIVTNEAHSLNYASGYPTLTLPNQQDVVTLRQLADRYGAHYVIVFGSVGLYPEALNEPAVKARLAATLPDVAVYELLPQ